MCQIYFSFPFIWITNTTALNGLVWAGVSASASTGVGAIVSVFCLNSMNEFLTKCSYICFVAGIEMDFNFMSDEALLMSVICSNWLNNEWPLCVCVRRRVCAFEWARAFCLQFIPLYFIFVLFCISFFLTLHVLSSSILASKMDKYF